MITIKSEIADLVLINAYPENREQLPGLIATSCDGEMFVIVAECEEEIVWQGQTVNNIRQNKWWGYRVNDPAQEKVLLCIDKHDIEQSRYLTRFFKKVEANGSH